MVVCARVVCAYACCVCLCVLCVCVYVCVHVFVYACCVYVHGRTDPDWVPVAVCSLARRHDRRRAHHFTKTRKKIVSKKSMH